VNNNKGDDLIMKELSRLRKLVKSRGAEERRCQMMRMEIRKLKEDKRWMEN